MTKDTAGFPSPPPVIPPPPKPPPDLLLDDSESFMTRTSTGIEKARFGGRSTPEYLTR